MWLRILPTPRRVQTPRPLPRPGGPQKDGPSPEASTNHIKHGARQPPERRSPESPPHLKTVSHPADPLGCWPQVCVSDRGAPALNTGKQRSRHADAEGGAGSGQVLLLPLPVDMTLMVVKGRRPLHGVAQPACLPPAPQKWWPAFTANV